MTVAFIRMGSAAALREHAAAREITSDEVLIRRIAGGDQLAMQTLFVRHRVALYRWLLRLVGDEALAEDLLATCFSTSGARPRSSRRAHQFLPGYWRSRATRQSPRCAAAPTTRSMRDHGRNSR